MKNCDSPRNEMPTPASSGMMWISSSNSRAGRISRYGSRRGVIHRAPRRRPPRAFGTAAGCVTSVMHAPIVESPRDRPADPAAGYSGLSPRLPWAPRGPPPPIPQRVMRGSAPASGGRRHLLVRRRQRRLDVGLAHRALGRGARDQLLERIADEGLHLPFLIDERHRLGVVGEDLVERLEV